MNCSIYTLSCPITSEVIYVGQTTQDLKIRLSNHLNDKANKLKFDYISKLKKRKAKPIISLLEVCSLKDANKSEQNWIDYYKKLGIHLLNQKCAYNNKKQITWQLSIDTVKKIKKLAKKTKQPINEVVKELILKGLEIEKLTIKNIKENDNKRINQFRS